MFCIYQALDSKVTIFTVAISRDADTGLEDLAQSTGGNAYFTLANDQSNAITEAFLDIGTYLKTGSFFGQCQDNGFCHSLHHNFSTFSGHYISERISSS